MAARRRSAWLGLNFLVPAVHRIRYVYSLKEEALSVPSQARGIVVWHCIFDTATSTVCTRDT